MTENRIDCASNEVVLIITGCISPILNQTSLILKDIKERYRQYIDCLKYYIEESLFCNIIFCDNSGYDVPDKEDLCNYALAKGKRLEWLSFRGDLEKTASIGNKGLGEDEIMDYIFANCDFARRSKSFVKITGRLQLKNIDVLLRAAEYGKNYFYRDLYGRVNHGVDTRFYVMDTKFYLNNIRKCYERSGNFNLRYEDTISELLDGKYELLPAYPKFIGSSSGNGFNYNKEGRVKLSFLSLLCWLGLYNKYYSIIFWYYAAIHKMREYLNCPYW